MIASKFGIGQQVRHKLLGYLGVVIDIDPEYSMEQPKADEIAANTDLRFAPWYHVVMEDEEGQPVHTWQKHSWTAKPRMPILNNLHWTSWRNLSVTSSKPRACATD